MALSSAKERGARITRRRRPRGSVIILALLTVIVMLMIGCVFLGFAERDNRFAGYQERSEKAWFLAQSGLEYYRVYGCGASGLSQTGRDLDPPRVLERHYVPAGSRQQYFEFADMGRGRLRISGAVEGTMTSADRKAVKVYRHLIVPAQNVERAYDPSTSLQRL